MNKKSYDNILRGGTEAGCCINYFNENRQYTKLVMFTDGYVENDLPDIRCKNAVWIISSSGDQERNFQGITIHIPKNR